MADAEQVAIIRRSAKEWNAWREENPSVPLDLCGADLRGVNLITADLSETQLRGAYLYEAELSNANLVLADLGGANLDRAKLRDADLKGAHFSNANLFGADLGRADLSRAKFGSTVIGNTNLKGVAGLDTCYHYEPSVIDYLTLAKFWPLPEAFLRGCGLPDALITYLSSLFRDGNSQFYSCFISYSHADKSFARRLHDTLQGRGIRCWLDEKQLLPGDDIYHVWIRVYGSGTRCCCAVPRIP